MSESAKALVSDLGAAIGFGNMMTLASQCWREMLLEKYGTDSGAFTVGPCVGSSEAKERAAKDARIAELEASVIRLEEEKAELNGLVDAQALEIEDLREARSHMATRIAELEAKLAALTTRQVSRG